MKTRVFAVCVVVFLFCGITHAGLSDGLVAYYPFNGNANDESGNRNNGTVNGSTLTTDRFGNANCAYSFDGVNDYITIQESDILKVTSELTITTWVKINSITSSLNLFSMSTPKTSPNCCAYGQPYELDIFNGKIGLTSWTSNTSFKTFFGNSLLSLDKWYHVAVTFNKGIINIFLNGTLDDNGSIPISVFEYPVVGYIPRIGANGGGDANGNCVIDRFLNGTLDDMRLYNRALSASEIQQLYQGQGTCSNSIVTFTAGTPAKAADVNANFGAHNCQIQALQSQVQALKSIVCADHPTASGCQ